MASTAGRTRSSRSTALSRPASIVEAMVNQETAPHVRAPEERQEDPRLRDGPEARHVQGSVRGRRDRPARPVERASRSSPTRSARRRQRPVACPIRTDAEQVMVVESTELMAKCPSKYDGAQRRTRSTPSSSERRGTMNDQSVPFSPIALVGTIALLAAYRRRRVVRRRRHRRQRAQEPPARQLVGLRPLRLRRADRPRVVADDLRVRHARLLDQVRRGDERYDDADRRTRSPRSGAASTARCCSGCSCSRCSRRSRSSSTTSATAT